MSEEKRGKPLLEELNIWNGVENSHVGNYVLFSFFVIDHNSSCEENMVQELQNCEESFQLFRLNWPNQHSDLH